MTLVPIVLDEETAFIIAVYNVWLCKVNIHSKIIKYN